MTVGALAHANGIGLSMNLMRIFSPSPSEMNLHLSRALAQAPEA